MDELLPKVKNIFAVASGKEWSRKDNCGGESCIGFGEVRAPA